MAASGSIGRVTGQVERILDEDQAARISVIVRMADPDEESRELVAAAAEAVRVRPHGRPRWPAWPPRSRRPAPPRPSSATRARRRCGR
ncbi:MAG TPA: hypothetical protein VF468_08370 [Actinomycetota bacterium]|nr:hypothetical protein [Actinomycetota bacterium]